MGLEEEIEVIENVDTPETICNKYDRKRKEKTESFYEGKTEKIMASYVILYRLFLGK